MSKRFRNGPTIIEYTRGLSADDLRVIMIMFAEHGVFPDPNVGPMELGMAVRRLNKAAAEARWTCKELRSFQMHAAKWYNELQGSWLYGSPPSDLPTLVRTVKGLIDWGEDTVAMATTLRSKRKIFWEKHVAAPFEPKHMVSGMRYRFGSLSTKEEPEGLRDAYDHAKALLAKSATPTPSVGSSEAQLEDEVMLDLTGAKTIDADQQDMDCDPSATTSTAPVPLAITSATPAPAAQCPPSPTASLGIAPPSESGSFSAASAASAVSTAAAPETRDSTTAHNSTAFYASPPPSALASTSSPVVPPPPFSKRKRGDEPEKPPRRVSKRISAGAVTATTELDAPRTRSAIKAAEMNANGTKGKSSKAKRAK